MRRNTKCVNALSGLSCYVAIVVNMWFRTVSMPSRAWVVTEKGELEKILGVFQCPLGLELLLVHISINYLTYMFQCPLGLELLRLFGELHGKPGEVSMPSRAWVVTISAHVNSRFTGCFNALSGLSCYPGLLAGRWSNTGCFNALSGLSCYRNLGIRKADEASVNALSGLSCYSKNVQYFKFFMILFMHTCYL